MDTKIRGLKYEEKQEICIVSKYYPTRYSLHMNKKILYSGSNPADTKLTK